MEQIVKPEISREGWGRGEWDDEPDYDAWRSKGFPCIARRNRYGAWCGYIGVPPGHPWHGKEYSTLEHVDVHGGLTYAERCNPEAGVCHVPRRGEPADFWWIGFDCAHAFDLSPGLKPMLKLELALPPERVEELYQGLGETYCDLDFIKRQCAHLARQAKRAR